MSEVRKELARIQSVRFGFGGYQGAMFGASFTLGGRGWGVGDFWGAWAPGVVDPDDHCKWTEADRIAQLADLCGRLSRLMKEAGVEDIGGLANKPIEVTFKNHNTLDSWRLLTEVLP